MSDADVKVAVIVDLIEFMRRHKSENKPTREDAVAMRAHLYAAGFSPGECLSIIDGLHFMHHIGLYPTPEFSRENAEQIVDALNPFPQSQAVN